MDNTPVDIDWDDVDFDDDGTAGGAADIPTPAELEAARKAREAREAGNIAGIGPLTAGRKVDDGLLGIFFSWDAESLDKLEAASLEARNRLEDAVRKNYKDSVVKAFRESYIESLGRQVGFQRYLARIYRSAGTFDFDLSDDSILTPAEIKRVNEAPMRDKDGLVIGSTDGRYALGRGVASSTLPKLRKRVAAADAVNSRLPIPDGWDLESASVVLDNIQNTIGPRVAKNARMKARLEESKNMFYGTILRKQGSPAIVRFQHSGDGGIDATPAEMQKVVEGIKAVEDAGINIKSLSPTSLFHGRDSKDAGAADLGGGAPFTIDVGLHARGAGFSSTSTIAYASNAGVIKVKLSKTRQYDSEEFRESQKGHHAVEATDALDSVFNTVIHEIGHIVQYRAFTSQEFLKYRSSGTGGRLNLIDGPDRVAGKYNEENGAEHWAEAIVEFVRRNKISPRMREILVTRGILLNF